MPSFRLSAVRVGVQPAAELRHLQRHNHAAHVLRALLPVPCPRICSRALSCTLRAPRSPAASRLPTRTLAPHRMPSVRLSAGRVSVQPAAELRHLQRHGHALHVLRALLPVPCSPICSRALPCTRCVHTAIARRPPALPGRTSYRTTCPPCDSADHTLLVQRQQAAHPLRVGGHLGLSLRLELGSGKLLAELSPLHRGA